MSEQPQNKQTVFNAGLASAQRLHNWLQQANECSANRELFAWQQCLEVVSREVASKLNTKELETCNTKLTRVNTAGETVAQLQRTDPRGQAVPAHTKNLKAYQNALHEFEVWLRTAADAHGMLSPLKESVDFAFEQGMG